MNIGRAAAIAGLLTATTVGQVWARGHRRHVAAPTYCALRNAAWPAVQQTSIHAQYALGYNSTIDVQRDKIGADHILRAALHRYGYHHGMYAMEAAYSDVWGHIWRAGYWGGLWSNAIGTDRTYYYWQQDQLESHAAEDGMPNLWHKIKKVC